MNNKELLYYQYNCTEPKDLSELNFIINNMQSITLQTFEKHVNSDDFKTLQIHLGYNTDFKISQDWHVRYAKSKTPNGNPAYLLIHSCIEYIFY